MATGGATALGNTRLWEMIHAERLRAVTMLEGLTPDQWRRASLCEGWSVRVAAAHLMASGEQTTPNFLWGMLRHGFRFNVMIDRNARRLGQLPPPVIVERLRKAEIIVAEGFQATPDRRQAIIDGALRAAEGRVAA